MFRDRYEDGRILAAKLKKYKKENGDFDYVQLSNRFSNYLPVRRDINGHLCYNELGKKEVKMIQAYF
jgi:hypothetical protein